MSQVLTDTEITYFIDCGYSGATIERPAFKELREWVKSSRIPRCLYVSRYDRISRDLKNALDFLVLCKSYNVELISVLEPMPSSLVAKRTAQELFIQILFSLAQFTRDTLIENLNNSLAQKKTQKKLLSINAAFGYLYYQGRLLPHEKDSLIVKEIFELYTKTTIGYKKLADQLNEVGKKFNGKVFKSHHIAQIIKNPIYAGIVASKSKNLESYLSIDIIPIVSQEIFQKATSKRLSRTLTKKDNREYPLRKKILCPICRINMLSPRRQLVRETEYHYYVCPNESCCQWLINAEEVETKTLDTVSHYLNQDNNFRQLIHALEQQISEANQAKKKSLVDVSKQKQKLFQEFEQGKINHDSFKQQLAIVNKQQVKIDQIKLSQSELNKKVRLFLRLSQTSSKELMWPFVEKVKIDKNKQMQEVVIYGIRIQSTSS